MQNGTNWTALHSASTEEILLGTLYSTIVLLGSVGNAMVVLVVWRTRKMHTTTNYLLSNLAVADFITLIWCPGIYDYVLFAVHPRGVLGDYICKLFTGNAIQAVTINVSAMTLTLVAIERYNALVRPMLAKARFTRKNVRYAITATWVVGILSCVPDFVYNTYSEKLGKCSRPWTLDMAHKMKAHIITTNVLLIIAPLLIMSFCYLQIMKGLYLTKTVISQNTPSAKDKETKKNLAKLLFSVTAVFYACCLPFGVFMIYLACGAPQSVEEINNGPYNTIHGFVRFFLFLNSSVNPFLYAWQSSNYRHGFKFLFRCDCRKEYDFSLSRGTLRTGKGYITGVSNRTQSHTIKF